MLTRSVICAFLFFLCSNLRAMQLPTIDPEDSIRMTRIQQTYRDEEDIAFSPDGNRFVTVVWRGDLESNRNIFSLLLFDLTKPSAGPVVLTTSMSRVDPLDPLDPVERLVPPISNLRFLSERTVAFLGAPSERPNQIYVVDIDTKEVRQVTNHPTSVRTFSASTDAHTFAFSALEVPNEQFRRELMQRGFSLWDARLFTPFSPEHGYGVLSKPTRTHYWSGAMLMGMARVAYGQLTEPVRQYFVSTAGVTRPLLRSGPPPMAVTINEGHLVQTPDLTVSPTGSHAILMPFSRSSLEASGRYRYFREIRNPAVRAMVTSLGLIDLRTGIAEPLLDTPIEFYNPTRPLWAADGRSAIVRSVLPPSSNDFETDPQLLEVDIESKRVRAIPGSRAWRPVRWTTDPETLILRQGSSIGRSVKRDSQWETVFTIASTAETSLNSRYALATNGAAVVGVKDALTTAPEMAVYDVVSKRTSTLTDLNPHLRQRRYGTVEKISWKGPTAKDTAFGYLIKPTDFVEGKRYPLVILLKDVSVPDPSDDSFVIDGQQQLSGWAIQTFAARGLLVLLTPPALSQVEVAGAAGEGPRITAHVENAIRYLDEQKLIDPRRVGLSGWSRAAYWTDYIITHSRFEFAAATDIDGGGNYKDFQQRWGAADEERDKDGRFTLDVRRVRTPLLSEQHGASSLIGQGEFITALVAFGKPVDLYYYPDAPHNLQAPAHRLHSLRRHVDWFRFWLQDYEDRDPEKRDQYERWRELRRLRDEKTPR